MVWVFFASTFSTKMQNVFVGKCKLHFVGNCNGLLATFSSQQITITDIFFVIM